MRATGRTLADVPARVPWSSLENLVGHLGPTSAYSRELAEERGDGKLLGWLDGSMVAPRLAELIDRVNQMLWQHACAHRGNGPKPRRPQPYPRPWESKGITRHVGDGAIPISEFHAWWKAAGEAARRRSEGESPTDVVPDCD